MKASSIREKLTWFANSGLPILPAVVVLISAAYLFRPRFVRPPVLLVDGVTYLAPSRHTLEPQEDLTYLGEVTGTAALDRTPKKDLQANHDIVGAAVYRRSDGNLAVLEDGLWYVYRAQK